MVIVIKLLLFLKGLTAVSLYVRSLKNIRLFGKIISSSQTDYPIAKSLVFLQKKLILHNGLLHMYEKVVSEGVCMVCPIYITYALR